MTETIIKPCIRCGEDTLNDKEAFEVVGACVCPKCAHAYAVFDLVHEQQKAAHKQNYEKKTVAGNASQRCADLFQHRYGFNWREQLRKSIPDFDLKLREGINDPITIDRAVSYYKTNGLL